MKAKIEDMVAIALDTFDPSQPAPFPIYLHLPKNEKFIPLRNAGDALGKETYLALTKSRFENLWTLLDHKAVLAEREVAAAGQIQGNDELLVEPTSERKAVRKAKIEEEDSEARLSRETESLRLDDLPDLVADVLTDDVLTSGDKAKLLSAAGQDMLRIINQVATRGEESRLEGFRRGKEVVDKILFVAAQNSDVYSEILKIWSSQDEIDHTTSVGTLCVMFAMCLGYIDEKLLSDMAVAALFHDIGLVEMGAIGGMKKREMSLQQSEQFRAHVGASARILRESGLEFHPRVLRMIEEHHENFDGSGYPKKLRGGAIDETSQLLHLANYFDRLCSGQEEGVEMSPAEAFDFIYDRAVQPGATLFVDPEIIERIFQFMEREAKLSGEVREKAEKLTQKIQGKESLGTNEVKR